MYRIRGTGEVWALVHECWSDLTAVPLALKLRQIRTPMMTAMSEAHKRSYRHPKYKTAYRVSNWPEYEKSIALLATAFTTSSRSTRPWRSTHRDARRSYHQGRTLCYLPSLLCLHPNEIVTLGRSYVTVGPSGNGRPGTTCTAMPRACSSVTRRFLAEDCVPGHKRHRNERRRSAVPC